MPRLVVVPAEGGPAFVEALQRAWDGGDAVHPLMVKSERYEPMRKITTQAERIV